MKQNVGYLKGDAKRLYGKTFFGITEVFGSPPAQHPYYEAPNSFFLYCLPAATTSNLI